MARSYRSVPVAVSALGLALSFAISDVNAATIAVNSNADTAADEGVCTLREAIVSANTNTVSGSSPGECAAGEPLPAVDTIAFAIPGAGVHTIRPTSQPPAVTEAVTIDGYTQPGASPNSLAIGDNAVLLIEIDGSGFDNEMFDLQGGGSTLRGLVINRVIATYLSLDSSNNTIEGNFLATDASGMSYLGTNTDVIRVQSSNNRIGGSEPASRNVIGATVALGSSTLFVQGGGTLIQGNYIGVNAAGSGPLQPDDRSTDAIFLIGSAPDTMIGGATPGAGNVILATNVGIDLRSTSANVTIQGNYIGTDATGTFGLGGGVGISGSAAVPALTIGGPEPLAGNLISGGTVGIAFFQAESDLVVQGNKIGTDASGTQAISNSSDGISGGGGTIPGLIGGTAPDEANTIAFNCGRGINLQSSTAWTILGNSIYSNGGTGILNSDAGPHPPPQITSLSINAGTATVSGTLDATASTTFRIEFYGNVVCDPSGAGEGRTFIGTTDVTTDADGHAVFGPLDFAVPDGEPVITATATDPDGSTSAFAQCAGSSDRLFRSGFEPAVCGGGF
ncbi:MAG: CSLREA domain-containing protein [Rhodanobacteraceae bacterium]